MLRYLLVVLALAAAFAFVEKAGGGHDPNGLTLLPDGPSAPNDAGGGYDPNG